MHPVNKHDRFKTGVLKGKRRAKFVMGDRQFYKSEEEYQEFKTRQERAHRNTSKICSCEMCGNPRRSEWAPKRDKLTMQERKAQA